MDLTVSTCNAANAADVAVENIYIDNAANAANAVCYIPLERLD